MIFTDSIDGDTIAELDIREIRYIICLNAGIDIRYIRYIICINPELSYSKTIRKTGFIDILVKTLEHILNLNVVR